MPPDSSAPTPAHTWGGSRAGAGRKPKGEFVPLDGDLAYAKNLVSVLMRDEAQPAELRARCAFAVVDGRAARCRRNVGGRDEASESMPPDSTSPIS